MQWQRAIAMSRTAGASARKGLIVGWTSPLRTFGQAGTRRATLSVQSIRFFSDTKGPAMKALTTLVVAALLAALAGCNTVEGAGKDVKATGNAVERAADNAKPK
jgi:predicted small secreted protein